MSNWNGHRPSTGAPRWVRTLGMVKAPARRPKVSPKLVGYAALLGKRASELTQDELEKYNQWRLT